MDNSCKITTKRNKKIFSVICLILITFSLISTQLISLEATSNEILINGLSFDKSFLTLYVGETNSLNVNVSPSNATDKSLSYSSSNTDVLTVNKNGDYTAIKSGYAYVNCTANDNSKTQSEILIIVKQKSDVTNPVESIDITKDYLSTYKVGDVDRISVSVGPTSANNRRVTFVSTDYDVVDISPVGFFKAVGQGSATIYCVAQDGSEVYDKFSVTVNPADVIATNLTLDKSNLVLSQDDTYKLTGTLSPANTTNKELTYTSSNSKIATVSSDGTITAISSGAVFITASTTDGSYKKDNCMVVVTPNDIKVTALELNKTSITLEVGETNQYTYSLTPSDATNKDVTFKSSDTSVATVTSKGLVTAVSSGSATITCTASDGSEVYDTSKVVVEEPLPDTNVTLNPTATKIYVGNHSYVNPTITPSGAKVTYSSSSTTIATVDSQGVVTGKKAGTATISVKDEDGKIVAKTSIQVTTQSSSFSISNTTSSIPVDKSVYIRSYGSSTTFTSSNTSIATVDKSNGYVYGKKEGVAIITAKSGSVVRTSVVTVTASAPVRFAYTSPNSATLNDRVYFYAITDNKKTAVKFIVDIDGVSTTVTASSKTTDSSGNYIWKGSTVIGEAGEFDVKTYSKTSSSSAWSTCSDGNTSAFVANASSPETASFDIRRPSDEIIELNATYEGFLSEVTDDPLVTYAPTLGHGNVIVGGETFYNNISRDEAYAYLVDTMNEDVFASSVNEFMQDNNIKFAQQHFDALVMFVYNLGPGALYNDDVFDILTDCVESTTTSNSTTAYVNASSGLRLREGPGTGYDTITIMSNNSKLTILSTSNKDWYKVKTSSGTIGYCSSDYLKFSSTTTVRNMYKVDDEDIQDELICWHHAGGECIWGLLYRRIDELEIFCYNDYKQDGYNNKYNMDYPWNC